MTASQLTIYDIIGLDLEAQYLGRRFAGTVVGETRNMVAMAVGNSVKWFPKRETRFILTLPDGSKVALEGVGLMGRTFERIRRGGWRWPKPVM